MSLCGVELVELHPILRYSVDIFSIVGPTGILSYVRKPNTLGVRVVELLNRLIGSISNR